MQLLQSRTQLASYSSGGTSRAASVVLASLLTLLLSSVRTANGFNSKCLEAPTDLTDELTVTACSEEGIEFGWSVNSDTRLLKMEYSCFYANDMVSENNSLVYTDASSGTRVVPYRVGTQSMRPGTHCSASACYFLGYRTYRYLAATGCTIPATQGSAQATVSATSSSNFIQFTTTQSQTPVATPAHSAQSPMATTSVPMTTPSVPMATPQASVSARKEQEETVSDATDGEEHQADALNETRVEVSTEDSSTSSSSQDSAVVQEKSVRDLSRTVLDSKELRPPSEASPWHIIIGVPICVFLLVIGGIALMAWQHRKNVAVAMTELN